MHLAGKINASLLATLCWVQRQMWRDLGVGWMLVATPAAQDTYTYTYVLTTSKNYKLKKKAHKVQRTQLSEHIERIAPRRLHVWQWSLKNNRFKQQKNVCWISCQLLVVARGSDLAHNLWVNSCQFPIAKIDGQQTNWNAAQPITKRTKYCQASKSMQGMKKGET